MENRVYTLYSGSAGNSVYFDLAGHEFLIDAGKSARTLCHALSDVGSDISHIEAIFITHEHGDHIGALETLTKKHRIPVHICSGAAQKLKNICGSALCECLCEHTPLYSVTLGDGDVKVSSFDTPHDSLGSVGYRIEYKNDDGETLDVGLATDIGCITDSIRRGLDGCRDVILESNHDIDMLVGGPYPQNLKMRILSKRGHLSNTDCAAFAAELCEHGTKNILLAHLSCENNTPEIALAETLSAVAGMNVHINVADRDNAVRLF